MLVSFLFTWTSSYIRNLIRIKCQKSGILLDNFKINAILPFCPLSLLCFPSSKINPTTWTFTPYIRTQRIQQIQALPAEAPHSSTLRIPPFPSEYFSERKTNGSKMLHCFLFPHVTCFIFSLCIPEQETV